MENCTLSKEYRRESDQELLEKLQVLAEELGHLPKRNEVPFAYELKGRFGPWPRVLEAAGLKEIGARYQRKQQKKKEGVKICIFWWTLRMCIARGCGE